MTMLTRRNVLKGVLQGSAITIGLPFLDCFLDGNGEALASGAPIPVRFGTWFWGCGVNASTWFPDRIGTDYELKSSLRDFAPYRDKLTVFSRFNCILGPGMPNLNHWCGVMATLTGAVPTKGGMGGGSTDVPTIDCLVADAIGKATRFPSIEIACTGQPGVSYSMRAGSTVNPSEVDPLNLYKRIFGPEFQDPNAGDFKPDPAIMVRQSVLSVVRDQREDLIRTVGAADRARVDQYFTSLRELEQQMELLLQKPAPAEACSVPSAPKALELGPLVDTAVNVHGLLGRLVVMALACNQTRIFNVALSTAPSNLRMAGSEDSWHALTHEEPTDEKLGYQPRSTAFVDKAMKALADLVGMLEATKEGDGTLLDRSLVLATSDSNFAKNHTLESLPILVAGRGGGRWKSGQHIAGKGDPSSRVGLTIQQALGMPVGSWGAGPMETSKPLTEVL